MRRGIIAIVLAAQGCAQYGPFRSVSFGLGTSEPEPDLSTPYNPSPDPDMRYRFTPEGFEIDGTGYRYTLHAIAPTLRSATCTLTLREVEITDTHCDDVADHAIINHMVHPMLKGEAKTEASRILQTYTQKYRFDVMRQRWLDHVSLENLRRY